MAGKDPFGIGAGRNPFGTQNANPFGTKTGPSTAVPMPKPDVVGDVGKGGLAETTDPIAAAGSPSPAPLPTPFVLTGSADVESERVGGVLVDPTPNREIGPSGSDSSHGQLDPATPAGLSNNLSIPDADDVEEM